jgi:hypothetical protein
MFKLKEPEKCKKCPYKLGIIKAIENPCIACRSSGRKTHPFPESTIKREDKGKKLLYCNTAAKEFS